MYSAAAVPVEIRPVASRRDMNAFVSLPWRLYSNEPHWVPPLRFELKRRLDRDRNPFFGHAEAEYFLARRDGRVVGRISAHYDRHLNEFQGNDWGLFGFFECEDDPEAAAALLDAAAEWNRSKGRDRIVGPMDFTTNDECGVLVEGFDRDPIILQPWTHRYYPRLLEGAGLQKAMDVFMWELHISDREMVHPIIWQVAEQVESKHGITVRSMRKKDIEAEVERFLEVYNAAWERNWGFVPLTDDEVRQYAKDLRPLLDERWAFIAEKDGEVIGAALTLPDYNQVLKHMNGRLLPFGWLTALRRRGKIDRVRVFALGVKPEHQHTGVAAAFYQRHFDEAERNPYVKGGEMGWILEVNKPMNRAMEGMNGRIVSRYRVYERLLAEGAEPAWPADAQPWVSRAERRAGLGPDTTAG
jgi:GNAT superfamily N-acetyltransferase